MSMYEKRSDSLLCQWIVLETISKKPLRNVNILTSLAELHKKSNVDNFILKSSWFQYKINLNDGSLFHPIHGIKAFGSL